MSMLTFAAPAPRLPLLPSLPRLPSLARWLAALGERMELRIDVQLPPCAIDDELEKLYERLHRPGDALYNLATVTTGLPDLVFRYREADGEYYVYVEDVARRCLAGYTVFNRLIEVGRRADRYLRAPHSKYAPAYRRRGIASAVYEWGLGAGLCLMSGARQSDGAHALWQALAQRHALGYVDVRGKKLHYLGTEVAPAVLADLHTRMILLGEGWSLERLAAQAGISGADGAAPPPPRRARVGAGQESRA